MRRRVQMFDREGKCPVLDFNVDQKNIKYHYDDLDLSSMLSAAGVMCALFVL